MEGLLEVQLQLFNITKTKWASKSVDQIDFNWCLFGLTLCASWNLKFVEFTYGIIININSLKLQTYDSRKKEKLKTKEHLVMKRSRY